MSRNISSATEVKLAAELARVRLIAQNKEQARAHLLQIQLILARQVPTAQK